VKNVDPCIDTGYEDR